MNIQIDKISNDEEQNNLISDNEIFQQEEGNIQTDPIINYQNIYQNPIKLNLYDNQNIKSQKIFKKELIKNNPHYITQSLAKKIIQENNQNLNITPINQDISNLTYSSPEKNQFIPNNNNSFMNINKSNNTVGINSYNNINYDINKEYESLSDDNEKLNELAKNIKENENKIEKMNKTMNEILLSKNKNEEINNTKSFIINQINDKYKIQQENITLKADSIIYREDINKLFELNNKYSEELEISRKKILDLISRNNDIEKDINHKDFQINKLNEIISRLRLYENPDMDYKIRNNKTKEEILHEIEFNIKICNEENNKLNTEKKILKEKIKDIIENKNNLNRNILLKNEQNNNVINKMDEKIKILEKEINNLANENNLLHLNNQKSEKDMEKLFIERNNIENKYNKKKEEFDKLKNDYNNLSKKYQQLLYENNRNIIYKNKKKDSENKNKKNNQNAINEMYNKIQILKSKVQQERDIEY